MRLPQDRILHIDTEFKDGKVNVVAEWQGELVQCKDCRYANECLKSVQYARNENDTIMLGYAQIEWCSRGEHKGGEDK